jgi:sterol desaturase/sphingolipid hydroxylase (fatty acid hydroxylase superfamily)
MWQYWWHRFNHEIKFFWRFHAVHHSDADMNASTAIRFHTFEIMMSSCLRLLVLPLAGVTVAHLLVYETLLLPIILFQHSNIRIPFKVDSCLRWLIVTPWMHWVHHSRYQPETDSNYSSLLSIWDRLFGSFRLNRHPETISLGLDSFPDKEWKSLLSVLKSPFKPR